MMFPLCRVSLAWAALQCLSARRVQVLGPLHGMRVSVSVLGLPRGAQATGVRPRGEEGLQLQGQGGSSEADSGAKSWGQ